MYIKTLLTLSLLDLVFIILAIPLILRIIPPNYWYGFRVKRTLKNKELWYSVNEYFGWGFLITSLISILGILIIFSAQIFAPVDYMNIGLLILLAPQLLVVLLTIRYMKRMDENIKSTRKNSDKRNRSNE
jgi:hypothetical protein